MTRGRGDAEATPPDTLRRHGQDRPDITPLSHG